MLQGILIIVVFLVIAALMMTKKIPTLLALPLMAVIICIIAGVPAVGTDAEGNAIGWLSWAVTVRWSLPSSWWWPWRSCSPR